MMVRLLFAAMLVLAFPFAASAQQVPEAAAGLWQQANNRTTFTLAHFSFPLTAGSLRFTRTFEFPHQRQGLDTGLQFESADQQIFGTVYVYRPGLAHTGLTDVMTDQVMRQQSEPDLRELSHGTVPAGGRPDGAIRADYSGFRHNLASSTAYIKAARWIVKIRVSGPDTRRADVAAAMSALIDGLRFDGSNQAFPAAPLTTESCTASVPAAHALPDNQDELTEATLLGTIDAAGEQAQDEHGRRLDPMLARMGSHWCMVRAGSGNATRLVLRAMQGGHEGLGGTSILLVAVNDAGTTLEMVESSRTHHFVALYHEIGRTFVLGHYDAALSNEQILAILDGSDREGSRIRATVEHLTDGTTSIDLPDSSNER